MNKIVVMETEKKDHYIMLFNGVNVLGEQERSTYRHIIEVLDKKIDTGL